MSITDEKTSRLLAEIHRLKSPEELYARWLLIDVLVMDAVMIGCMIAVLVLRDIIILILLASVSLGVAGVYWGVKSDARHNLTAGRQFLDANVIIGDMENPEVIPITRHVYKVLPRYTIDGEEIQYQKKDVDETLKTLQSVGVRVGGASALLPEVVNDLIRMRLEELKEEEESKLESTSFLTRVFRRPQKRAKMRKIGDAVNAET